MRPGMPVAAAVGVLLVGASAAPSNAASSGGTTTTFTVSGGALGITIPASAALGTSTPGGTVSAQLGAVSVSDNRALLTAAWTTSVTSSSFTTGGGTSAETIPAAGVSYWSGVATATSGVGTFTPGQATALVAATLDTSRTAYTLTVGVGDNSATWNPTLVVALPAAAVGGTYTGTVTHSVA